MPLFIDRHELSETVNAETAARHHLNDLKIQHKYNCRKISYWFDEKRQTAFCLFEAPSRESMEAMHKHAHGNIQTQITEIDEGIVNAFLKQIGRIHKIDRLELPDALPTVLVSRICVNEGTGNRAKSVKRLQKTYSTLISEATQRFSGNIISQSGEYFLIAFQSGPAAIKCALKMYKAYRKNTQDKHLLKIGISGRIPSSQEGSTIKSSIKLAKRLCNISQSKILVTLEVNNLFHSKNTKVTIEGDCIQSVSPDNIRFITSLMDYMEGHWKNHSLQAVDFENELGCSKSQIYRRMMAIMGQSPNTFIKEYRLDRAKELLRNNSGNISEIAFDSGFSSPSYFAKCFYKKYGVKPSDYFSTLK